MTKPRPVRATPIVPVEPPPVPTVGIGGWLSWLYLLGGAAALSAMALLSWVQNCTVGVAP